MAKINGFTGNYTGLDAQEVHCRLKRYGSNELVSERKNTFLVKAISVFKEPMFLLLFGTALLYFVLGEPRDGFIMLGFVTFMSGINLFQEWRTDRTLKALRNLSAPRISVIRDGGVLNINSRDLTVGDLMILEEGEKIPADGQILEMFDLGVDESTLTGESDVVWKKTRLEGSETDAHWRKDQCYASTMVTQGSAIVQVTEIGAGTEYGKIGIDILKVAQQPSPLEKQTRHLVKVCALIGLVLFMAVFLITLMHSRSVIQSLLSAITLAMSMIPEEFPVVLTIFLTMGAWRLARNKALIRRIPAVETLGAVTVLCVDKTGTLTKNQMAVQEVYVFGNKDEKEVLVWAGQGCENEPYDPMERAILEKLLSIGISREKLFAHPLLHEYTFSSEDKMMGHVWDMDGGPMLAAKGSPESILKLCGLTHAEQLTLEQAQESMARKGYRVIAVACRTNMTDIPPKIHDNKLVFLGLIGLEDPAREAVPGSISICHKAGIRVVMITGDNGTTAQSIAKKVGIAPGEKVITGQQIDSMNDEQLIEAVKTTNIFARVIPRHKMRIVKAIKDSGEIVAMTGDGVNDASALKYADIGIAMGKRGTEVAREAADMILMDDNFTTIVDTIRDGRRIYDNIRKAMGYVFVVHIPIALIALLTPLLHLPLLLLPIHVALLELIIDPTCSIIFERQPAEADIMERGPRHPETALINRHILGKAILQGLVVFFAAFGCYIWLLKAGWAQESARTFSLLVLAFSSLLLVYIEQSEKTYAISNVLRLKDRVIWYVTVAILAALGLVVYFPPMNVMAKTAALPSGMVGIALLVAVFATFWWDVIKAIALWRNRSS
jgi:Ca2+-transporting ATPase